MQKFIYLEPFGVQNKLTCHQFCRDSVISQSTCMYKVKIITIAKIKAGGLN